MIRRIGKNLGLHDGPAPSESRALEVDGCTMVRAVLTAAEITELRAEIDEVFAATVPERSRTDAVEFRYEMLHRSAAAQRAVAHPRILEVIDPLGADTPRARELVGLHPPYFYDG